MTSGLGPSCLYKPETEVARMDQLLAACATYELINELCAPNYTSHIESVFSPDEDED